MARRLLHRKSRTRSARQSGFAGLDNAGAGAAGGATGEDGKCLERIAASPSNRDRARSWCWWSRNWARISAWPPAPWRIFGLTEMRLVAPRDGWPSEKARATSSGALHIVDAAQVFDDVTAALHDVTLAFATTARERGQMKRVLSPQESMREAVAEFSAGGRVAILFGARALGPRQ